MSFASPDRNYSQPFDFFVWFPFREPLSFVFFLPHCHSVMLQTCSSRFSLTRITTDKMPFYVSFFVLQHPFLKTSFFSSRNILCPFDRSVQNYYIYIYIYFIVRLGALERTDIVSAYLPIMPLGPQSKSGV